MSYELWVMSYELQVARKNGEFMFWFAEVVSLEFKLALIFVDRPILFVTVSPTRRNRAG